MPPRSPNAGRRTQGSRSAGKPRPTPVLLALQQHEYLSEQSHHELGAHILQSLMEMQPNCPPNFELDFRRLVPLGPEGDITQAWLNDTLLSVGVKHIRAGMPDPSAEPQGAVVPACICILDGFVATNLVALRSVVSPKRCTTTCLVVCLTCTQCSGQETLPTI